MCRCFSQNSGLSKLRNNNEKSKIRLWGIWKVHWLCTIYLTQCNIRKQQPRTVRACFQYEDFPTMTSSTILLCLLKKLCRAGAGLPLVAATFSYRRRWFWSYHADVINWISRRSCRFERRASSSWPCVVGEAGFFADAVAGSATEEVADLS